MAKKKIVIMGAAGRDFHNFNIFFRDNPDYEVVAFTATQIPGIDDKKYPPELAGSLYPQGIQIFSEDKLTEIIKKHDVSEVILAYSDLSHEEVMHKASLVLSNGADFRLMGTKNTMLESKVPVISICAVRTGCGKSQTTRKICNILRQKGKRVVAIRHPMPYGDLVKQAVQRFETMEDLDLHDCTIEEREEYEPLINQGTVVYAGVDYGRILAEAEKEADIIVWDGGNNDFPFFKPNLHMVVLDPHRPNHEIRYHPGETNFRMADVIIINKIGTASRENVNILRNNIESINPKAVVIEAESTISVDDPAEIKGKRVLVVEDGPSVTHGEMPYGAGEIAVEKYHAAEVVDPRIHATGSIRNTFEKYPHLTKILPAMGYSDEQIDELQQTMNASDCDVVVAGTPIDLARVVKANKPVVRVKYELQEMGEPNLETVLRDF
ncbi:MAG: GTPase [Methanomassiliicoccales archaeon]|nr:MAG: GTPase [Methanomassiliicoccales archaeon]